MSLADRIAAFLQENSEDICDDWDDPGALVLTNYVCICEWADGQGRRWLSQHAPSLAPFWHLAGMLDAARAELIRKPRD